MSTKPLIKRNNILSALYGAIGSTLSVVLVLVLSAVYTTSPEDDSGLRSAAALLGFVPVIFLTLFIYFLCLSFKRKNRLKFVFLVQVLWTSMLSLFMGLVALKHHGLYEGLAAAGAWLLVLSLFLSPGSWVSTLPKKAT